ncbi:hypothetical protein I2486_14800 [Cellulophaga sp. E16_2]|uniref:hypothetical protein n=1 Tax=unclassified Cellulophaga TaxID=2634405 RepID=UPI0013FD6EE6|nr:MULTISPECIES: hypothetical protein [unclassified Cellulophaga]MBO0592671.1 hypothetical protein [Cellulophaga sp. E16_2]
MKTTILSVVLLGFAFQSYAQDMLYRAKIKVEDVPEIVVAAIDEDFPDYAILEYEAVPVEYVEGDVYFNPNIESLEDYDTFQVILKGNGNEMTATYDSEGNLLNITEHLKDLALPIAVRHSLAKAYPGWSYAKDTYTMVQYKNSKEKQRYRIVLENHGKKIRVHTNAKGKILNHHKRA